MKRLVIGILFLALGACSRETEVTKNSNGNLNALNPLRTQGTSSSRTFGCPKGTHPAGNVGTVKVRCTESATKSCGAFSRPGDNYYHAALYCNFKVDYVIEGSCPNGSYVEREPKCEVEPQPPSWIALFENVNYCQQLQGDYQNYNCNPRGSGPATDFLCLNCVPDAPQPPISNDPEDPNTPPNPPKPPTNPEPSTSPNPQPPTNPQPPPKTKEECRKDYDQCMTDAKEALAACYKAVGLAEANCMDGCEGKKDQASCEKACAQAAVKGAQKCEDDNKDATNKCEGDYRKCFEKAEQLVNISNVGSSNK